MIVRTSDQILAAALSRLVRETSISVTTPGSVARTFFEIISEELGYNYRIMDANLSQLFVSSAGGEALNKLGTLFGVTRAASMSKIDKNEGRVYFYLNSSPSHVPGTSDLANAGDAIVIPAGTLISTQEVGPWLNPIAWRTVDDASIPTGEHMVFVSVEPVSTTVNTVGAGSISFHNITSQQNLYVHNRLDLEVVEEIESDTNYRYRITNAINLAAKSNAIALRLAALGTDGVRDCKVMPLAHGIGTVGVIIILDDPTTGNAATVFSNAMAAVKDAASVGDLVVSARPTETRVDVTATLIGDGLTAPIRNAAAGAIRRYIASLSVGDPVSSARIVSEAMSVSPKIKDFAIIDGGFVLGGTPSVFTKVQAKSTQQFFPGTITIL